MSDKMLFEKILKFRRNGWTIERASENGLVYINAQNGRANIFLGSYKRKVGRK